MLGQEATIMAGLARRLSVHHTHTRDVILYSHISSLSHPMHCQCLGSLICSVERGFFPLVLCVFSVGISNHLTMLEGNS